MNEEGLILRNGMDSRDVPEPFKEFWLHGRNCLVIVADSLRWDVYKKADMPNLRACLIDEKPGYAMGTMTPPAFAAFMIGMPPFVDKHYKLFPHCVNLPATLAIEYEYITGLFSSNGWAHPQTMTLKGGRPPWTMHSLSVAEIHNAMIAATQIYDVEPGAKTFAVYWSDRTHHPYISRTRSKIKDEVPEDRTGLHDHEFEAQRCAAELLDYEIKYLIDQYRKYGGGPLLFFADHGEYLGEPPPGRFGHGVFYEGYEQIMKVPVCVGEVK